MMDPHYYWNLPTRPTLTAVGINDIDDYKIDIDDDNDDDYNENHTPTGIDAEG